MTLELKERTNWDGAKEWWIYKDGSPQSPIYHDADTASKAFDKMHDYYQNPTPDVIVRSVEITTPTR